MKRQEIDYILRLARMVKASADEPDNNDVSRLMMDSFVGGSFEAGVVSALYYVMKNQDRDRYQKIDQHLHSAHNKIKRQHRALKRKTEQIALKEETISQAMQLAKESIDRAEAANKKAERMQWIAEHMEQAISDGIREKQEACDKEVAQVKSDAKFHVNMLEVQYAQTTEKYYKQCDKALIEVETYLKNMKEYTDQPRKNINIGNILTSTSTALENLKAMREKLFELKKSV